MWYYCIFQISSEPTADSVVICDGTIRASIALLPGHSSDIRLLKEDQEGLDETDELQLHPSTFKVADDRERLQRRCGGAGTHLPQNNFNLNAFFYHLF